MELFGETARAVTAIADCKRAFSQENFMETSFLSFPLFLRRGED